MDTQLQSVGDYLRTIEGVSVAHVSLDDWILYQPSNREYRISVEEKELSRGVARLVRVELEPARLEICVSYAPEYLNVNITNWVEYELVKKIAEKYGITVEEIDNSLFYIDHVFNPEGVDDLLGAVREYDRLSKSDDIKALKKQVPKLMNDELDRIVGWE